MNLDAFFPDSRSKVTLWYMSPEAFRYYANQSIEFSLEMAEKFDDIPSLELGKTHLELGDLYIPKCDTNDEAVCSQVCSDIFGKFQAEVWSPRGEARELIQKQGLSHTSMTTGDIIQIDDRYFAYTKSYAYCDITHLIN